MPETTTRYRVINAAHFTQARTERKHYATPGDAAARVFEIMREFGPAHMWVEVEPRSWIRKGTTKNVQIVPVTIKQTTP